MGLPELLVSHEIVLEKQSGRFFCSRLQTDMNDTESRIAVDVLGAELAHKHLLNRLFVLLEKLSRWRSLLRSQQAICSSFGLRGLVITKQDV